MANLGKVALAMLGILAYQNRAKIGDAIRGVGQDAHTGSAGGGLLDQVSNGLSGTALGDVLDRLRDAGAGSKVDSWVGKGRNEPLAPRELEAALDERTLSSLSRQTGLSREELIARLTQALPATVDEMTPDGSVPAAHTANSENLLDDVTRI